MGEIKINKKTGKLALSKGFKDSKLLWEYYDTKYKTWFTTNKEGGISGKEKTIQRPTQSILQKWLREKHKIDILFHRTFSNGIKEYILTPCFDEPTPKGYKSVKEKNYEKALELALQQALKLIK